MAVLIHHSTSGKLKLYNYYWDAGKTVPYVSVGSYISMNYQLPINFSDVNNPQSPLIYIPFDNPHLLVELSIYVPTSIVSNETLFFDYIGFNNFSNPPIKHSVIGVYVFNESGDTEISAIPNVPSITFNTNDSAGNFKTFTPMVICYNAYIFYVPRFIGRVAVTNGGLYRANIFFSYKFLEL